MNLDSSVGFGRWARLSTVCASYSSRSSERLTEEAADLVYDLMLLLAVRGIGLADVVKELERSHRATR